MQEKEARNPPPAACCPKRVEVLRQKSHSFTAHKKERQRANHTNSDAPWSYSDRTMPPHKKQPKPRKFKALRPKSSSPRWQPRRGSSRAGSGTRRAGPNEVPRRRERSISSAIFCGCWLSATPWLGTVEHDKKERTQKAPAREAKKGGGGEQRVPGVRKRTSSDAQTFLVPTS